ncbi:protoporphyrinogen oxidase [soil metagenome]
MDTTPLDDLAARAHDTHVVVVGGGIAGLVAAFACAKVGIRVTVLEASGRLGGAIRTAEVGGMRADLGAEGYATRGGAVRALVEELGLIDAVVPTVPRAEWIAGLPGGSLPFPAATLRGIPENPWEQSVRRVIGWRGTWRAYVDRVRPPLTIGQERSLGKLVRTRMGELVLDRLVAPLSLGGFLIHPDDVDVEVAVPGLGAALTRTGSLAGAVSSLLDSARKNDNDSARKSDNDSARKSDTAAGDRLEGIDGGMSRIVDALHERLRTLGADVRVNSPVAAVEAGTGGRWMLRLDATGVLSSAPSTIAAAGTDDAADTAAAGTIDAADIVILATGAEAAYKLLHEVVPSLEPTPITDLEVVTLVVSSADLAAAPARTAAYPVTGTAVAASVTDSTARWPWMLPDADTRVLKVTFGGRGVGPATAALEDRAAAALALAEASALLDVPLAATQLRASRRDRWAQPPPISALGRRDAAAAARTAIHAVPGLAVVGAWVAGTGLAQVVPDALAEAERVRRLTLWAGADERA